MPQLEELHWISKGYSGTAQTIQAMKDLVDQAKKKKPIIDLARRIVYYIPERDHRGEGKAVFEWVKANVRFVNDPYAVETLQRPEYLILEEYPSGDCDDLSTLYNSLMAALGYDTRFKTIKADLRVPNEFSHVYAQVNIDGEWISADPSQKTRPFGWEPPSKYPYQVWGYSDGVLRKKQVSPSLKGLGMPPKLNLKQLFMNLVGGKAVQAPAPAPAQPVAPKTPAQAVIPPDRSSESILFDESFYEITPDYDPDEFFYYNDYDDEGAGSYVMGRQERLVAKGGPADVVGQTLRVPVQNYADWHRDDERFAGRQMPEFPEERRSAIQNEPEMPPYVPEYYVQ